MLPKMVNGYGYVAIFSNATENGYVTKMTTVCMTDAGSLGLLHVKRYFEPCSGALHAFHLRFSPQWPFWQQPAAMPLYGQYSVHSELI